METRFSMSMPMPGRFKTADELARIEAEEAARERAARIARANIPPRFADADIANCGDQVKEYARSILDGGSGWLLLTGSNGRGKTYSACAIAREAASKAPVLFVTVKDMVEAIQADRAALRVYSNVPFLVLDDLGKEDGASWKQSDVFAVIQRRESHMRPTVFTTNLSPGEMLAHYSGVEQNGNAIVSRLKLAKIVTLTGEDRRRP